jgi:predicted ribosome quality control (RQC) complex YloA/Tae2 family protein
VNEKTLEAVTNELRTILPGKRFGRVYSLSRRSFAVDLRLSESRYLLIAVEPANPRIYLIRRRLKELERSSENPQPFHLFLKKYLSGAEITSIDRPSGERVVYFRLSGIDELGISKTATLTIQLTGKSSNIFLVDQRGLIVSSLIDKDLDGQRIGDRYSIPVRSVNGAIRNLEDIEVERINGSVSDALDQRQLEREVAERFKSQAENARRVILRDIAKRQKLLDRLGRDLEGHGEANKWKRYGDLILANLSTAKRQDDKVIVTDYFDQNTPQVEIEADKNVSLTDMAQKYFKRYTKAQNAALEVQRRKSVIESELALLLKKRTELEKAIVDRNEAYLASNPGVEIAGNKKKEKPRFTGVRQFTSSDGFEILVGKRAADNDQLTFRIAGPVDLWLHAADYPGSHVIVRNPNRKEIPPTTLLEAAKLAAFYSSGKTQPKAAVHYTQKKFVNKPKGAAPGLVRLASFKTIMVEPSIPEALDHKAKN